MIPRLPSSTTPRISALQYQDESPHLHTLLLYLYIYTKIDNKSYEPLHDTISNAHITKRTAGTFHSDHEACTFYLLPSRSLLRLEVFVTALLPVQTFQHCFTLLMQFIQSRQLLQIGIIIKHLEEHIEPVVPIRVDDLHRPFSNTPHSDMVDNDSQASNNRYTDRKPRPR